ncbi:MAG: DoxX family protein [Chloroflexota bacterium]
MTRPYGYQRERVGEYSNTLSALAMGLSGVTKLMVHPDWVIEFNNFGYPIWFMYLIGILQVAAAIGLWISRTRFISAALIVVIMIGAAVSNAMVGKVEDIVVDVVLIALAGLVAWMSRTSWPLSR